MFIAEHYGLLCCLYWDCYYLDSVLDFYIFKKNINFQDLGVETVVHGLESRPHLENWNLLEETSPRFIILYDADVSFVRQIECFQANNPNLKIRLVIYYSSTGLPTKDETSETSEQNCLIITFITPCNCELVYFFVQSVNRQHKEYI